MALRQQFWISLLMLAVLALSSAGIATLAHTTSVITDHVAREEALHRSSNGVNFYDGGYIDDGDFLLLGELPRADYARGGVYFIGSSETRASITPWTLPEEERALIHNYSIGDLRHTEVMHFVRMLVEENGLLDAGPEKTTLVLSNYYQLARAKDLSVPIDRYVEFLFERHSMYSYDWDEGIHLTRISDAERALRIERDRANCFLRILISRPSRVRPYPAPMEWRINHLNEVMGENWQADMGVETEKFAELLDYLEAQGVRVVVLYPPMGSWQDGLPYDRAYRALIDPIVAARGLEAVDYSDFLTDAEFGDDVHPNYAGQARLHEAYRVLALEQLQAMGTPLAPTQSGAD